MNFNGKKYNFRYNYFNNILDYKPIKKINSRYSFRYCYFNNISKYLKEIIGYTKIPVFDSILNKLNRNISGNNPNISIVSSSTSNSTSSSTSTSSNTPLSTPNDFISKPPKVFSFNYDKPFASLLNKPGESTNKPKNENIFFIKPFSEKKINLSEIILPELKNIIDENNKATEQEDESTYEFQLLDVDINSISDLIKLGRDYESIYKPMKKRFNINIKLLANLIEPLEKLNDMIGMDNIKNAIFNKIIFYLQGLDNKNQDFLHTVLYGGPGMGKTEVAKIIGNIYTKLGFLSKGKFIEAKITDLKAGYLGQTEIKTQKLLDDAKGSVLFIDEAYSIGSNDKIDNFSQSIIDLLNPYLDKHKDDFALIIAGYKDELEKRFFQGNQGLHSRFGLWLEIEEYKPIDLKNIFIKKIVDYGWKYVESDIDEEFFKKNREYFKYFGRDIQNFFSKCKEAHAKRVLHLYPEDKKKINRDDIEKGFTIYKNDLDLNKNDASRSFYSSLYC